MPRINRSYDKLVTYPGDEIPYVMGRRTLRVDYICSMYRSQGLDVVQIAESKRLPRRTVQQAIDWCEENGGIVSRVWEEQARQAGLS